jgi:hypothetical protein
MRSGENGRKSIPNASALRQVKAPESSVLRDSDSADVSVSRAVQGRYGNTVVRAALGGGAGGLHRTIARQMALASANVRGSMAGQDGPSNRAMQSALRDAASEGLDLNDPAVRAIGHTSGSPLPESVRSQFEAAFDHDFSGVRIHVGGMAAQASEALAAHAFTVGRDIWFGGSEYAPGTAAGDRLLAHELTHVVQHDEGRISSGGGGMDVSSPTDTLEREAYANEGVITGRLGGDALADASLAAASEGFAVDGVGPTLGMDGAFSGSGLVSGEIGGPSLAAESAGPAVDSGATASAASAVVSRRQTQRPTDEQVGATMDALQEQFETVPVQLPVRIGGPSGQITRIPVTIRIGYRINYNNDNDSTRLSGAVTQATTPVDQRSRTQLAAPGGQVHYDQAQATELRSSINYARQGKATPGQYGQVIQAAIDLGQISGLPVAATTADAPGGQLNAAGRERLIELARSHIATYAQNSFGTDCSGFAVQVASQLAGGDANLAETWGMGGADPRMNIGSQSNNNRPAITDPAAFRPGQWLVTGGEIGHVRVLRSSRAVATTTLDQPTRDALRAAMGADLPATIYEVMAYEQHSGQPHVDQGATDYVGASGTAATAKWGNERTKHYVVSQTTTNRRKQTTTTNTWFIDEGGGSVRRVSGMAVRDVPVGPPAAQEASVPRPRPRPANRKARGRARRDADGDAPRGGRGDRLPTELSPVLSRALGRAVDQVRVHADGAAARFADRLSARAVTVGRDIFFGRGEFDPGSKGGQELLAHEVHHAVRGGGDGVSQPGDGHERSADRFASQATGELDRVAEPGGTAGGGDLGDQVASLGVELITGVAQAALRTAIGEIAGEFGGGRGGRGGRGDRDQRRSERRNERHQARRNGRGEANDEQDAQARARSEGARRREQHRNQRGDHRDTRAESPEERGARGASQRDERQAERAGNSGRGSGARRDPETRVGHRPADRAERRPGQGDGQDAGRPGQNGRNDRTGRGGGAQADQPAHGARGGDSARGPAGRDGAGGGRDGGGGGRGRGGPDQGAEGERQGRGGQGADQGRGGGQGRGQGDDEAQGPGRGRGRGGPGEAQGPGGEGGGEGRGGRRGGGRGGEGAAGPAEGDRGGAREGRRGDGDRQDGPGIEAGPGLPPGERRDRPGPGGLERPQLVQPQVDRKVDQKVKENTGQTVEQHRQQVQMDIDRLISDTEMRQYDLVMKSEQLVTQAQSELDGRLASVRGEIAGLRDGIRGTYGDARAQVVAAASAARTRIDGEAATARTNLATSLATNKDLLTQAATEANTALTTIQESGLKPFEDMLKDAAQYYQDAGLDKANALAQAKATILATFTSGTTAFERYVGEAKGRAAGRLVDQAVADFRSGASAKSTEVLGALPSFQQLITDLIVPLQTGVADLTTQGTTALDTAFTQADGQITTDLTSAKAAIDAAESSATGSLTSAENAAVQELDAAGIRLEGDISMAKDSVSTDITNTTAELMGRYSDFAKDVGEQLPQDKPVTRRAAEGFLQGQRDALQEMHTVAGGALDNVVQSASARIDQTIAGSMDRIRGLAGRNQGQASAITAQQVGAINEAAGQFSTSLTAVATAVDTAFQEHVQPQITLLQTNTTNVETELTTQLENSRTLAQTQCTDWQKELQGKIDTMATTIKPQVDAAAAGIRPDLERRANAIYSAMAGWGTDEKGSFNALRGLSALGGAAFEEVYRQLKGKDVRSQICDEMDGDDERIALAYLSGNTAEGARLELNNSMRWYGDDEAQIEKILRELSPEDLATMQAAPQWAATRQRLMSNLDGTDLDVTRSLLVGNVARADAYRLQESIDKARREGDADALHRALEGVDPAQLAAVQQEFHNIRSGVQPDQTNVPPVDQALAAQELGEYATRSVRGQREINGPNRDLAVALATQGRNSVDASVTRFEVERTRRGGPNQENLEKALFAPPELQEALHSPDPQTRAAAQQQLSERQTQMNARYADMYAKGDSSGAAMQNTIGSMYANSQDPNDAVRRRMAVNMFEDGTNSPRVASDMVHLSITGAGTREADLKRSLAGMRPDEVQALQEQYARDHGNGQPDALFRDLGVVQRDQDGNRVADHSGFGSELSGDDRREVEELLHGDPRYMNDRQRMGLSSTQADWAVGSEAGMMSGLFGDDHEANMIRQHQAELQRLRGQNGFDANGNLRGSDADREAFGTASRGVGYSASDYRASVDRAANYATTGIAVVGAVAATVATGGLAAAAIAGGAGLLSMGVNAAAKGGRYGWEQATTDFAMTGVNAATAGVGAHLNAGIGVAKNAGTITAAGALGRQALVAGGTGFVNGAAATATTDGTWDRGIMSGVGQTALGGGKQALTDVVSSGVSGGLDETRLAQSMVNRNYASAFLAKGTTNAAGALASGVTGLGVDYATGKAQGDFLDNAGSLTQSVGQAFLAGGTGGLKGHSDYRADQRRQAALPHVQPELPGMPAHVPQPGEQQVLPGLEGHAPRAPTADGQEAAQPQPGPRQLELDLGQPRQMELALSNAADSNRGTTGRVAPAEESPSRPAVNQRLQDDALINDLANWHNQGRITTDDAYRIIDADPATRQARYEELRVQVAQADVDPAVQQARGQVRNDEAIFDRVARMESEGRITRDQADGMLAGDDPAQWERRLAAQESTERNQVRDQALVDRLHAAAPAGGEPGRPVDLPEVFDSLTIGAGFAGISNEAGQLQGGVGGNRLVIGGRNPWEGASMRLGQPAGQSEVANPTTGTGMRETATSGNDRYMRAGEHADNVAMQRDLHGVSVYPGQAGPAESRPAAGAGPAWPDFAAGANVRLPVTGPDGQVRYIYTKRLDMAAGAGPSRPLPTSVLPDAVRQSMPEGVLLGGDQAFRPDMVAPGSSVAVVGAGASSAWSVEASAQNARDVHWIGREQRASNPDWSADLRTRHAEIEQRIQTAATPEARQRAEAEMTRFMFAEVPGNGNLPRNQQRGAAFDETLHRSADRPDAPIQQHVVQANPDSGEMDMRISYEPQEPGGRSRVRIQMADGREIWADHLVTAIGQSGTRPGGPGDLLRNFNGQLEPILGPPDATGFRPVVGLQSPDGAIRVLGAAATSPSVVSHMADQHAARRYSDELRRQATASDVPADSQTVVGSFHHAEKMIRGANATLLDEARRTAPEQFTRANREAGVDPEAVRQPAQDAQATSARTQPQENRAAPTEQTGNPTADVRSALAMNHAEWASNPAAQRAVFDAADGAVQRMRAAGQAIIGDMPGAEVVSIRKRNDIDAFVTEVVKKQRNENYGQISDMADIVRGRFNVDTREQVDAVVQRLQDQFGADVVKVKQPREGYPRWHINVRDAQSGLVHEWQVGTRGTSAFFETRSLTIPPTVTEFKGAPDFHDGVYKLLNRVQSPEMRARYGIDALMPEYKALAESTGQVTGTQTRPDGYDQNYAAMNRLINEKLAAIESDRPGYFDLVLTGREPTGGGPRP